MNLCCPNCGHVILVGQAQGEGQRPPGNAGGMSGPSGSGSSIDEQSSG